MTQAGIHMSELDLAWLVALLAAVANALALVAIRQLARQRDTAREKLADAYQFAGAAIHLLDKRIPAREAVRALDYFADTEGPADQRFLPWPRHSNPSKPEGAP